MTTKQFVAKNGVSTTSPSNFGNVHVTGTIHVSNTDYMVIGNTSTTAFFANSSYMFVGNTSVNAAINSTSFLINGSPLSTSGVGGSSNTQVMFNDSGSANGSAGLTFDKSTGLVTANQLKVNNTVVTIANTTSNTAFIYLGNTGTKAFGFDGANFTFYGGTVYTNNTDMQVANGTSNVATIYLGNTGTRYLQYDGTNYNLPGGQLYVNGGSAWHSGNDGSGSGLDADTLDGYDSAAFARLAGSPTFSTKLTVAVNLGLNVIANNSGAVAQIEIQNGSSGAAAIAFHRVGSYAAYLGLDTDNVLKYGGWSLGNASYKVWHEGVDGSGSGLDADLLDGYQASAFALLASSPTFTGTVTASAYNTSSSREIKKNITDKVPSNIHGVHLKAYNLKEDPTNQQHYGVIAEELEETYPELVTIDENGKKAVNMMGLFVVFMKKVQKQDKYIAALENRITTLEANIP